MSCFYSIIALKLPMSTKKKVRTHYGKCSLWPMVFRSTFLYGTKKRLARRCISHFNKLTGIRGIRILSITGERGGKTFNFNQYLGIVDTQTFNVSSN